MRWIVEALTAVLEMSELQKDLKQAVTIVWTQTVAAVEIKMGQVCFPGILVVDPHTLRRQNSLVLEALAVLGMCFDWKLLRCSAESLKTTMQGQEDLMIVRIVQSCMQKEGELTSICTKPKRYSTITIKCTIIH